MRIQNPDTFAEDITGYINRIPNDIKRVYNAPDSERSLNHQKESDRLMLK